MVDIQDVYIAFLEDEEFDLSFKRSVKNRVVELWKEGHSSECMAREIKRDEDEVAVLLIDLARRGEVMKRRNGVRGVCCCLFRGVNS